MPIACGARELVKDGLVLLIGTGAFLALGLRGAIDARDEVQLDEYQLGVHAVTNAEYERFVSATNHHGPFIQELPLLATLDGRPGERAFREMCADYAWSNRRPPSIAARTPSRSCGGPMPRRTVVGWPVPPTTRSVSRPRQNGSMRRAPA